jgi:aminocarboxymuconate-semialdehyde decarboxylase
MVGELGFAGALVNPYDGRSGGPRYLDDPACGPLLSAAERLGRPLFVHPTRDLPADEHWRDFVLSLIMGRPTQTSVCAARLIFTGALDRHPRLDLLLAHGGGVLPFVAGRLDATWVAYRPERWHGPDILEVEPSTYLRRFHVDTNTWSVPALRLLLEVMGPDRLVVGNDQPPVWVPLDDSLALLAGLDLTDAEREHVLWRNAMRLFRLRGVAGA